MTSRAEKVQYVLTQPQTQRHLCHWPECTKPVPPAMWGCKQHWFKLPKKLRDQVWQAYEPGQEVNGDPSSTYLEVMKEVYRWIREATRVDPWS